MAATAVAIWCVVLECGLAPVEALAETVRVAALRSWPPEYSLNEEGEPAGFAIELFDEVAKRAGLEFRYRIVDSFPEAIAALESLQVDVIPNMGITEARREIFGFTRPVETFSIALFVRREQLAVRGLASLEGHPLAAVRSNAALPILRQRHRGPIRVYSDVRGALFDLLAGKVDGLAYPRPVVEGLARDARVEDLIQIAGPPLAEVKRGIAVRADRPELLASLDAAIEELASSSAYQEIYSRWYGRPRAFWSPRRVVWAMGGLLLLALVGMGTWRYFGILRLNRRLGDSMRERQRAKDALRHEQARFQAIAESLAEGLILVDLEGWVVYVNPQLAEMLAIDERESLGKRLWELHPAFGTREELIARLQRRGEGAVDSYAIEVPEDGDRNRWLEVRASPFRDAEGRIVGALAALIDVTERRWVEEQLRQREQEAAESQRMEAIGRLARGVAHDYNNILAAVLGYSDLLRESLSENDARRSHVDQIRKAAEQASVLTRQLLAFSREQILEPISLDLNEVAREMEGTLQGLILRRGELRFELAPVLPRVTADRGQIGQVLLNLVVNARDAMPDDGLVEVRTRFSEAGPERGKGNGGPCAVLEVEDHGGGIAPEILDHIFEPFFTTKSKGQGNGLGLATVLGIVQQSGGLVEVDNRPGEGVTFRVLLPAVEPVPDASDRPRGTVLVVDDDEPIRLLVETFLERGGFEVLTSSSPEEALALAETHSIDVLVSDVSLAGSSGIELARRLTVRWPRIQVLLISGLADSAELRREGLVHLPKPFTAAQLLEKVGGLLR